MQKRTLDVLKNFSQISPKILISAGDMLRTRDITGNVFAFARVPDTFPVTFALYDLNEFLATWSMFKEPEITYREDYLTIKQGRASVKYITSSPKAVPQVPTTELPLGECLLRFHMTSEQIEQAQKASSVLSLKNLSITKNAVTVLDCDTDNGSTFECEYTTLSDISTVPDNMVWNIDFRDLKMLPDGYTFEVMQKALKVVGDLGDVFYVAAYKQI